MPQQLTDPHPSPEVVEADRVYRQYVRPLENAHRGDYVVVAPDGRMVIRPEAAAAIEEAVTSLGRGHFLFRIGEAVVGPLP